MLNLFINTITRAIGILSGYFIFTTIVIMVFALIAHNLMGDLDPLYANYMDCIGQLIIIFLGKLNMIDLRSNHFTKYQVLLIYSYNIVYIVLGFMILNKYLTVAVAETYHHTLKEYKLNQPPSTHSTHSPQHIDDLFLLFYIVYDLIYFIIGRPLKIIFLFLYLPIQNALIKYQDKKLIQKRKKIMIRTQKERLEREKMQVLLQYGEEEMQL